MILENEAGLLKDQTPIHSDDSCLSMQDSDFDSTLNPTELLHQAVNLLRQEENTVAIKLLKKACDLEPLNAQLHAFLGAALAEELQIEEAQAEIELALKLNSQDAFIQLKAGELMLLLGRTPEALPHLEKAYKLPAPSPQTRLYIVNLLRQTRQNSRKLMPRENRLVGVGAFKLVRSLFTRSRDKKAFGIQAALTEQNRGEI